MHLGQPLQKLHKLLENFSFCTFSVAVHQQSYTISSALGSSSFNSYKICNSKQNKISLSLLALLHRNKFNPIVLISKNVFIVNSRLDSKPTKVPGNALIKIRMSCH